MINVHHGSHYSNGSSRVGVPTGNPGGDILGHILHVQGGVPAFGGLHRQHGLRGGPHGLVRHRWHRPGLKWRRLFQKARLFSQIQFGSCNYKTVQLFETVTISFEGRQHAAHRWCKQRLLRPKKRPQVRLVFGHSNNTNILFCHFSS